LSIESARKIEDKMTRSQGVNRKKEEDNLTVSSSYNTQSQPLLIRVTSVLSPEPL
jgi:hypothetical protein